MINIIILVLVSILISRLATYLVWGSLIKDKEFLLRLEKEIKKGSELNQYDLTIIYIGELPFISKLPFDILGYYYINRVGVVPRWSKCHKLIKAEYNKLKV